MSPPPSFQLTIPWLETTFPELSAFIGLGMGGQKLVFSAMHASEGEVVLKIFQPAQTVEEVNREVLAVQTIGSSHVPRILATGSVPTPLGACYWFREQRIHGETLRERLQRGPLDPLDVLRLARDLARALAAAELASIVHRDVKPENIIIDGIGKAWLLDFGLARHLTLTSLTLTGMAFGKMTPGYAPPEQCRNDKRAIDARADLFALGVTLYEAATGTNPFRHGARDDLDILHRTNSSPLPLLNMNIAESASFRDLISALTQKRRLHRPADIRSTVTWIEDICARNGI